MMSDIDERLEEIRKRAEAATPGPWKWQGKHSGYYGNLYGEDEILYPVGYDAEGIYIKDMDADFVAHARDDIPWLLDTIAALRARLEAQGQQPHPPDDDTQGIR